MPHMVEREAPCAYIPACFQLLGIVGSIACLMPPGTDDSARRLAKPFCKLGFQNDIKGRPSLAFVTIISHSSHPPSIILSSVWDHFSSVLSNLPELWEACVLSLSSEGLIDSPTGTMAFCLRSQQQLKIWNRPKADNNS